MDLVVVLVGVIRAGVLCVCDLARLFPLRLVLITQFL